MALSNGLNTPITTGLFAPELIIGSGQTGILYNVQTGHWQLVGNMVFFNILVALLNKGSETGDVAIFNFPWSCIASPLSAQFMTCNNVSLNGGFTSFSLFPSAGTSLLPLGQVGNNTNSAAITNANLNNNSEFFITGSFLITV